MLLVVAIRSRGDSRTATELRAGPVRRVGEGHREGVGQPLRRGLTPFHRRFGIN